jgi:hypothetical protein
MIANRLLADNFFVGLAVPENEINIFAALAVGL